MATQLRVKTELQQDFDFEIPTSLPAPSAGDNYGIFYPTLNTTIDENGETSVFVHSQSPGSGSAQFWNMYFDKTQSTWNKEVVPIPNLGNPVIASISNYDPYTSFVFAKNPFTGKISIAFTQPFLASSNVVVHCVFFLNGDSKWPQWSVSSVDDSSRAVNSFNYQTNLAITFTDSNTPVVYIREDVGAAVPASQSPGLMWLWRPLSNGPPTFLGIPGLDQVAITNMHLGDSVDPFDATSSTPINAIYASMRNPIFNGNPYYEPVMIDISNGPQWHSIVPLQFRGQFNNVSYAFPGDSSTSPIAVGTLGKPYVSPNQSGVVWVQAATSKSLSAPAPMFGDISNVAQKTAIWAEVILTRPDGSDGESASEIQFPLQPFTIHVLAAFQSATDNSFELWHCMNIPGALTMVADGTYGFIDGTKAWTASTLLTTDILSRKQYNFRTSSNASAAWPDRPFSLFVKGDSPAVALVDSTLRVSLYERLRETGSWQQTIIESVPTSKPTNSPSNVYFLELTAIQADGTPVGHVNAVIGSDSDLDMKVNNLDVALGPGFEHTTTFGSSGLLAVEVAANDQLIPPSFWISFDGMEPGAKIDVQPGPNGFQETLSALQSQPLSTVMITVNGQSEPLVPAGVNPNLTSAANDALVKLATVLTDSSSAADRRYLYSSTSSFVAGIKHQDPSKRRIGKLSGNRGFGILIDFRNGLQSKVLNEDEIVSYRNSLKSDNLKDWYSFFEDLGSIWQNLKEGVTTISTVFIDTTSSVVTAAITFVRNQVQGAVEFVMDLASHVGEVASLVLDEISVGFDRLTAWLGYLFDWSDIVANVQIFETRVNAAPAIFNDWLTNTIQPLTTQFFQDANAQVDSVFQSFEQSVFGEETLSAVLGGSQAKQLSPSSGTAQTQDQIDSMPSSANWLAARCLGPLNTINMPSPSDVGSSQEYANLEQIFSNLYENVSDRLQAALVPFSNLLSSITDKGVFEAQTLATLVEAVKSLVHFGLKTVQNVVNAFVQLLQLVCQQIVDALNSPIESGPLIWLYQNITGAQDIPTIGKICGLIFATPYTILYKIVDADTAAKGKATAQRGELEAQTDPFYLATGVAIIVEAFLGTFGEVVDEFAESYMQAFFALSMVGTGAGEPQNKPDLSSAFGSIPPGVDIALKSLDLVTLATTVVRVTHMFISPRGKISARISEKYDVAKKVYTILKGALGVCTLGMAIWSLTPSDLTQKEKLIGAGVFLGGFRDATFFSEFVPHAGFRVGFIVVRFVSGIAEGTLYIVASQQSDGNAVAQDKGRAIEGNVSTEPTQTVTAEEKDAQKGDAEGTSHSQVYVLR